MSFTLTRTQPSPQFGQINLERFYDNEGAQHSYIEINLSKNRYDYYFTHQLNSIQSGPIPALTTLTERYQPQDLTQPSIFSGFKRDLLAIVKQAKSAFPQWLDDYSQDELSSVQALLTRPDSYIRKSSQGGDYFLSIPHSNNALRGLEGLPPQSTISYVPWPPPNPTMGILGSKSGTSANNTSNPALISKPVTNPASINAQQPVPFKPPETGIQGDNPSSSQPIDSTPWS